MTGPAAPPDGVEARPAYAPPATPSRPAPTPPGVRRPPPRDRVLHLVAAAGGAGLFVILVAAAVGMPGHPDVVVEVRSEAVVLSPDTALDLIAAMRRRTDAPAAVLLDPAWLSVRADSVTARFPGTLLAAGDTTRALPAAMLRHLELTAGCELHVDRLDDGWIRFGIRAATRRPRRVTEDTTCHLRAEIWTGDAPEPAGSPRPEGWLAGVPGRQAIEIHARPTESQAATLHLRPAAPFRLRGIPVWHLSFETDARGPIPESSALGGTMRFPRLGDASATIHSYDALTLGEVQGTIVELAAGDEPATLFRGTASDPRIARESRQPTMLQWLYHIEPLRLLVAIVVGLIALVAGVIQAIRSW